MIDTWNTILAKRTKQHEKEKQENCNVEAHIYTDIIKRRVKIFNKILDGMENTADNVKTEFEVCGTKEGGSFNDIKDERSTRNYVAHQEQN